MTAFDWLGAQDNQPFPSTEGGSTGYFSAPSDRLDPALFMGDIMKRQAIDEIMRPLLSFMIRQLKLRGPGDWLRAWLAGSGITYQWSADRGNGDLDVLLGVDRARFDELNEDFAGFGDTELATYLNGHLKDSLWPQMSNALIGGKHFEVTYFYNPGTGEDIKNIHPYAAYDLTRQGKWVVRPPERVAADVKFPAHWHELVGEDKARTDAYVTRYKSLYNSLRSAPAGSPGFINAGAGLNLVTTQAHALLDDIHLGRRVAFQGGGKGYLDWHNFRWQEAKGNGVVKALSEILGVRKQAEEKSDTDLYGGKLSAPDELLNRAMLQRKNDGDR